jgi:hypothetical protein
MSNNFQESSINGASYIRFSEIRISNPLDQGPQIQYYVERVTNLSDCRVIKENIGCVQEPFNPSKVIELVDRETLEKTGSTILMGDLYPLLFSAAIQCHKESSQND